LLERVDADLAIHERHCFASRDLAKQRIYHRVREQAGPTRWGIRARV
jgi:hypothetical protein